MKKDKWHKKRHTIWMNTFRPIMRAVVKQKFGFKSDRLKMPKGPAVILSNHLTNYDPFMLACNTNEIMYFVISSDAFSKKYVGNFIRHTVNPIPKTKGINDLSCVKTMFQVLKEGYKVALFPEGNRSMSGEIGHIDESISKFIKKAGVPLYIFNILGGYGVSPRWSRKNRKGEAHSILKASYSAHDISLMSVEEIQEAVVSNLKTDPLTYPIKETNINIAEDLETALYYCPDCKKFETIESKGDYVFCNNCGYKLKYNHDLTFTKEFGKTEIHDVSEWMKIQTDVMNNFVPTEEIIFKDENVKLFEVDEIEGLKLEFEIAEISISKNKIRFENKFKYMEFFIDDIQSVSLFKKNTLHIHYKDGNYRVVGDIKFNGFKYLQVFWRIKNYLNNNKSNILGI